MSFMTWIDDGNINATQDYTTFEKDSQRQEGFKGGTPASAIRVNTALRQSSLVIVALMKALGVADNLNYRSTTTDVQTAISTRLNDIITKVKVNDSKHSNSADAATNVTTNINGKAISTIFEANGTTIKNATNAVDTQNVTQSINGKAISSIFESNGTTVKNATTASTASDTSSAIINVSMYLSIYTGNPNSTSSEQVIGPLNFRGIGIKVGSNWYGNLYYDCLQNKGNANISDIFAITLGRPRTGQTFSEAGLMYVHTIMDHAANESWTLLYPANGYNYISSRSEQEYRATTKFTLNRDGTGNYRSSIIVYGVTMNV